MKSQLHLEEVELDSPTMNEKWEMYFSVKLN